MNDDRNGADRILGEESNRFGRSTKAVTRVALAVAAGIALS